MPPRIEHFSARHEFTHAGAPPGQRRPGARCPASAGAIDRHHPGPHDQRGRPRGLRPHELRPDPGPTHPRRRDPLGLRRHLRRSLEAADPARRHPDELAPEAPASCGRRIATGRSDGTWSSRSRRPSSPPQFANGHLVFAVPLAPKGTWHVCMLWLPVINRRRARALTVTRSSSSRPSSITTVLPPVGIEADHPTLPAIWRQAVADMEALRIEEFAVGRSVFVPAAGHPLVRHAVRARLAGRGDGLDQRLPRIRHRRARSTGRLPGNRRQPGAGQGAGQGAPRAALRRARRARAVAVRALLRDPRRDVRCSWSSCRTPTSGRPTSASSGATGRRPRRRCAG